ncbi:hypothetical protein MMC06_002774 [Schaereria dolodes]|nr:hypothetical protein [Schaereria dolodes]
MRLECLPAGPSVTQDHFTFLIGDIPESKLAFHSPSPASATSVRRQSLKRTRSRADVDGEGSENVQKKKRRLRLNLITSRLSRPYASPTTHIITRGALKIPVWARQNMAGRNPLRPLRKLAMINLIRIKSAQARKAEQRSQVSGNERSNRIRPGNVNIESIESGSRWQQSLKAQAFQKSYTPPTLSPLGLSNYDVLDQEGDPYDEEDLDEVDCESVNSDWNILEPTESKLDDDDSFAFSESKSIGRHPAIPSEEEILDLVTKGERHVESSFSHFGT